MSNSKLKRRILACLLSFALILPNAGTLAFAEGSEPAAIAEETASSETILITEPTLPDETEPVAPGDEDPLVEEPTVVVAPAEEPPVETAPVEEQPAVEPPTETAPVEEPPAKELPAEIAPVKEPPVETAPVEEPPAEEPPAETAPVEEPRAEESPAEIVPVEEPVVENPPAEKAPVKETPVDIAPVTESEDLEEAGPEELGLDNMPPTPHPKVTTPQVWYAPGSLGSALTLNSINGKNSLSTTNPGDVSFDKSAKPVPGLVNTWDVTLRIEGKDDVKVETTDVVLVIDRSGSMASGNRMVNAKLAANTFIDEVILADPNIRIAIVSFSSDYDGAVLVTTNHGFSKERGTLKSAVNGLVASGGTHTQAGIVRGQTLLTGSGADNKYMVLLSDGQPTYSYRPTNWTTGLPDWGTKGNVNQNNRQLTAVYDGSYSTTNIVGTGNDLTQSYTTDSGWDQRRRHVHNGFAAIKAGEDARVGIDGLFTIAVGAGTDGTPILKDIASPGMAYSTDDPTELQEIYDRIKTQIQTSYGIRNAVIVDELGDGFSLVGVQPGYTIVKTEGSFEVTPPQGSSNEIITWEIDPAVQKLIPGSTNTRYAEMTYRVEINPEILDVSAINRDGNLYFTNKSATFKYKDTKDATVNKVFQRPKVNPIFLKVTKSLLGENGLPVESSNDEFKIKITSASSGAGTIYNKFEKIFTVKHGQTVVSTDLRLWGNYTIEELNSSAYDVTIMVGETKTNRLYVDFPHPLDDSGQPDINVKVINQPKISVIANKVWVGGLHSDIWFGLYRKIDGGTPVAVPGIEIKPLPIGTTEVTWDGLPGFDQNGKKYIYSVKEFINTSDTDIALTLGVPAGYVKTEDGLTVTNTWQTVDTSNITSISVTKKWVNVPQGTNPQAVIELFDADAPNTVIRSATLTPTNNTITWNNLPYEKGTPPVRINYQIREVDVFGYESSTPIKHPVTISNMIRTPENNNLSWSIQDPSFIVTKPTGNQPYVIWTLNHLPTAERAAFIANFHAAAAAGGVILGPFGSLSLSDPIIWIEGPVVNYDIYPGDSSKGLITINVEFDAAGNITESNIDFQTKSSWTQFIVGTYSAQEFTLTNTYKEYGVTVAKEVTGNMGDYDKLFNFEAQIRNSAGFLIQELADFELAHGDEKAISVPVGTVLWLKETNAAGYAITITKTVNNVETVVSPEGGWYKIKISAGLSIHVENNNEVVIDTGIRLSSLPFILVLSGALVGLGLIFIRRRRTLV